VSTIVYILLLFTAFCTHLKLVIKITTTLSAILHESVQIDFRRDLRKYAMVAFLLCVQKKFVIISLYFSAVVRNSDICTTSVSY
jgi:hypothetical protein